jgi:hypothetical protein
MQLSQYGQELVNGSTCCSAYPVEKDGKQFICISNGLSYWGRIEDGEGNFVETLNSEYDYEENYKPNFSAYDLEKAGYRAVSNVT